MEIHTWKQLQVKLAYCKEAVTVADCKKMISKETLPKVKESDSIMAKWRELVHSASMTAGLNAGLNFADMQMAAFTLGITIPGEDLKRYKTAAALAHDIVLILQGISGVSLDSPWKAHAQAPDQEKSSSSSAAPKVVLMRELNEDGTVKDCENMLREMGYLIGSHVRRAADGEAGQIIAIQGRTVRLQQANGVSKVSVDAFLSNEWSTFVPKAEVQTITDVMMYAPTSFPEFQRQTLLAKCWLDLCDLQKKHEGSEVLSNLSIQLKPRKGVQVTGFIPRGKLVLIPVGLQLKHGLQEPEDNRFPIIVPVDGLHVWVPPVTVLPKAESEQGFLNPAFLVQTLPSAADCNMSLAHIKSERTKGVKLPMLKNTHDLKEGDFLYMFRGKKDVEVEALVFSPEKPQKDSEHEAPAKRRRTKGM